MSRLEDLIQSLCPDGVEYLPLGKLCVSLPKGTLTQDRLKEAFQYPVINSGRDYYGRYSEYNNDGNALVIASRGNAGFITYISEKFWAGGLCYPYRSNNENKAHTKYIFYILKNSEQKIMDSLVTRGSIPALNKDDIEKFSIPLPPLPVQEEIVRILDTFSDVVAELEAELAARVRQYEHYRNELLSFDSKSKIMEKLLANFCPDGVDYFELQEVFDFRNGYTPSTVNKAFWENGSISWFTMKDLRTNGGLLSESIEKITPAAVKGGLFEKDSIIISTSATVGEHALLLVNALANQRFTCLTRKTKYKNSLNPKFVFYYCFMLDKWCRENTNVSGFASVDMGRFARFKFPVPPLEIQEQIVSILDRFDALVNDLKSGLPAEIALRRKQYEYYRDKLLTFKPIQPPL